MVVASASLFRVCRDADVELDENDGLKQAGAWSRRSCASAASSRSCGSRCSPNADPAMVAELVERFGLDAEDVYEMSAAARLHDAVRDRRPRVAELRDPAWTPLPPLALEAPTATSSRRSAAGDILLHHPYESFYASVERFIREAADDPQTLSIKMTVYRVGDDTPFVRSLIAAAEAGKQVACVIELNARFDEERNLHWSRELEKVGAHVMFGVTGLKTHSKVGAGRPQGGRRHPQLCPHRAPATTTRARRRLYEDVGPAHRRPGDHRATSSRCSTS